MKTKLPITLRLATLGLLGALSVQPSLAQRPLGVDVSDIQGSGINWTAVKNAGYSFAWAKATEGTGYTASSFAPNENNGKGAGVYIGGYDFARPDLVGPTAEAAYFWSVAGPYVKSDGKSLMPMLDMETFQGLVGASSYGDWVNQWSDAIVADAAGASVTVRPVLYTTTCEACNLNSSMTQWIPWIANPSGESAQTGSPWDFTSCGNCDWWGGWDVWQYDWNGSVSGIPGAVDRDVFNGSLSSLASTLVAGGHSRIDSYVGNDGSGIMQVFLPDAVNVTESEWQTSPNGAWTGWSSSGGPVCYGTPPEMGYNADQRMQLFVRGADNNMWTIWKLALNGGWSGWNNYGGNIAGNLTTGYLPNGAMQVFARSAGNTVQTIWQTAANGGWTAWSDMGGSCFGDPVCGANADGRMQLFVRGVNNTVQSNFKTTSGSWAGWSDYGGSCYGKPAVANLEDGRMQVFIRSSSNTVQTVAQTSPNGGWGTWTDMGGSCFGDPVVGYNADERMQLFIPTSAGAISSNYKTTTSPNAPWSGWGSMGGSYGSDLTVGYNADGRMQLFMRDPGYNMQTVWQTNVNGGWGAWQNYGGNTPAVSITTQPQSTTVIQGQNASFSVVAAHALTYQWTFGGANISGATASSYTIANAQPANAGSYAVVVGNNGSTVTSSTAVLTVNTGTPPSITTQPASQTVIQGQSATFSVAAAGTAPLNYQWTFNGGNISGATATSYTIASAQPANAGSYAVVVTNVAGTVTSSTATLTVNVPPAITTQPASQTVIQGQSATFSVVAAGTAPLNYQWTFNGGNISGATATSYTIASAQPANAGSYAVVVTNVAGTVTSSTATLTVNVPPSITTQPASQTVKQGQNATFSVVAAGTAPLSYQWTFNGGNISGATASSYTVSNVQLGNAGNYAVVVTNVAGTVTSANAVLSVNPHSNPMVSANADGRQELFAVGSDGALYHSYQAATNGTNWSGWVSLGGTLNVGAVLAGGISSSSEIEIFAINTNGTMYHIWQTTPNTTNSWSAWTSLGANLWSPTATVASGKDGSGRRFVFTIGTDNQLYYAYFSGAWSSWAGMGGTWSQAGDIGIRNDLDGFMNVFLIGSSGNLYTKYQTSTNATSWGSSYDDLMGTFSQSAHIAAGANSDGRVEVFVINTSGLLYHNWETSPNGIFATTNWSGLGTNTWPGNARPIVGNDKNGSQHVCLIGSTGSLQHIYQAPGWSSWSSLGGSFAQNANPFIGANQDGRLEVYCVATGFDLEANYETAVNGQSAWNGWGNPVPGGTLFY